jgi:hypothetical protein
MARIRYQPTHADSLVRARTEIGGGGWWSGGRGWVCCIAGVVLQLRYHLSSLSLLHPSLTMLAFCL